MKPINLNKSRKARAKVDRRAQADENAVKFGRSKVERDRARAEVNRLKAALDGAKREAE